MFALLKKKKKEKKSKVGPLIAVVVFVLLVAGTGKKAIQHSPGGKVHSTSLSGTLNCTQLEELWESAGGSPSAAFLAAEVAMAESSGRQYATDDDGNGTVDEGYWQVNSIHGTTYDPLGNAEDAVRISDDGTYWKPWVTYDHGREIGQC
jgi:hypothetical protein